MFNNLLNRKNGKANGHLVSEQTSTFTEEVLFSLSPGGGERPAADQMITVASQLINQLEQDPDLLPDSAKFHLWHNGQHRFKFLEEYYPALMLAAALEKPTQVAEYQERIIDLVNLDTAEKVQELIYCETGYGRPLYEYPRAIPKKQFTIPIKTHPRYLRGNRYEVREA